MLTERWALVEADFQRYYRLDLRRELNATGVRRLLALIEGLPVDAAVWREDKPGWTQADELAALQIEMADMWGRILAMCLGAKSGKLPKPPQLTHPDRVRLKEKPRVTTDQAEIAAFFSRHLKGGGAVA